MKNVTYKRSAIIFAMIFCFLVGFLIAYFILEAMLMDFIYRVIVGVFQLPDDKAVILYDELMQHMYTIIKGLYSVPYS